MKRTSIQKQRRRWNRRALALKAVADLQAETAGEWISGKIETSQYDARMEAIERCADYLRDAHGIAPKGA